MTIDKTKEGRALDRYRAKTSNSLSGKRIICKAHAETNRLIMSRVLKKGSTRTSYRSGANRITIATSWPERRITPLGDPAAKGTRP